MSSRRTILLVSTATVVAMVVAAALVDRTRPLALGYVVLAVLPVMLMASVLESRRSSWKSGVVGLIGAPLGAFLRRSSP